MIRRNFLSLVALAVVAVAGVELALPPAYARDGDLRIQLTGPGGSGSARFRSRGNRSEFQVEAERLKGVKAGSVLTVNVDDKAAGTMKVTAGLARLELSNERKQAVPAIEAGSVVTIADADGKVLMSGKF